MNTIPSEKAIVVTGLGIDGILFKAGIEIINNTDAEFGRNIKTVHKKADLTYGRIEGIKKTEDKKNIKIDLVLINENGKELQDKEGNPRVDTVTVPIKGDYPYTEDSWTTSRKQAVAQCDLINEQFEAGLKPLLEMIQAHLDMVKIAKECSMEAKESNLEDRNPLNDE